MFSDDKKILALISVIMSARIMSGHSAANVSLYVFELIVLFFYGVRKNRSITKISDSEESTSPTVTFITASTAPGQTFKAIK